MTVAKDKGKPADDILEQEDTSLELSVTGVIRSQLDAMSPEWRAILGKVAYYVSVVGLSLDEACILSDTTAQRLEEVADMHPVVNMVIERKRIEHKKDLLKVISHKARTGDDKLAQWLLEKNYPEEFGKRGRGGGGDEDNVLAAAVQFIQNSGDSQPLVKSSAGQAVIFRGKKDDAVQSLRDMLA